MINLEMGLLGLLALGLQLYAIYSVVTSGASVLSKVLWTLALLCLPVISFIAWLFFGPRGGR